MAIVQISKIQQRSGNLVDLPQLDEAEFGWANDSKRLFIGKTTPNENIEVLTSYSAISFSQIDGSIGNLNINPIDLANGQLLVFSGTDWVNRGGNAGGLITLGEVSNVKITGGAIGYVLQTDGTGNLSWTPKGTLATDILTVSQADPAVVTTVSDNFFTNGAQVTIVDPQGMSQLAGNIYYANVLNSTTFALYSDDTLVTTIDSTGYNAYSYTTVSATTVGSNVITVANSSPFTIGSAVKFIGDMTTSNISNTATYYVQSKPNTTSLKIATSSDANASNVVPLQTTSGLTSEVYQINGQAISTISSGVALSAAGGTDTQVQFNKTGQLFGSASLTFDYNTNLLTLSGNANIGKVSVSTSGNVGVVTANILVSNITTGTAPLIVSSTTQVANLNAATAGTVLTAAQPNITSVGTLSSVTSSGNIVGANIVATAYNIRSINVAITAAGSTQGTATALAKDINIVSTVSSGADGVVLPSATAGMVLLVNNTSANTLNVYPAAGGVINSSSTDAPYSHSSGASIQYYATSSTQWYTVGATFT